MLPASGITHGQSAVETLIMVGIAIAFILPMVLLFYSTAGIRTQTLSQVQAKGLAQQMADAAGEVWYEGNGSRKVLLLNYPDRLQSIRLGGDLLLDDSGNPLPCPPANLPYPPPTSRISAAHLSEQLHAASREIIITLDNAPSSPTESVAIAPGMVCNAASSMAQRLDYAPGGRPGSWLPSGLVLLVFTNRGDYVSITRQYGNSY